MEDHGEEISGETKESVEPEETNESAQIIDTSQKSIEPALEVSLKSSEILVENEELDPDELESRHNETLDSIPAIDEEKLSSVEDQVSGHEAFVSDEIFQEMPSLDEEPPFFVDEEIRRRLEIIYEGRESMRSVELEEMARDDDITAEELELQQPLDDWVCDLAPGMRELLAPDLYSAESDITELPPGPVEPLEPCDIPAVLISQSPMLQRFQATLRAHLLRQKDKLQSDINDMDMECNNADKEIRDIAITVNKEQEHLVKQRDLIIKYRSGIEEVLSKRKQFDNAIDKKKNELKDIEVQYKETTAEDKSLFQQCEEMNQLAFQLAEMEKAQNDELKSAKNLSEKQRLDRLKLAKEKQTQDLYIWKLNQELEKLNDEITVLMEATEMKKKEINQLAQVVSDVETDTEALRRENSMIICATQQLVHRIKAKDKSFQDANVKVSKAEGELQVVLTRIRSFNKSLKAENDRQNQLQSSKNKIEMLFQRSQHLEHILEQKHVEALEKLAQLQNMISAIDSEQTNNKSEENELALQLKNISKEKDELSMKKLNLRKKYLDIMNEMKVQTAVTKKLQKNIEDLSHENQDIGLRKLEVDCKIGELMTDIEHSKVKRAQLEVKIDNLKSALKDKESELKSMDCQKKKLHQQIASYRSKVIGANKRLENLNKYNDESEGQPQLARRINTLMSELAELDEKINQAKMFWMDTQNSLIEQTYKLSQLEATTNTTRKHLYLTRYKKEKLDNKVVDIETTIRKSEKEFTWYHSKLTSMTLENYRHEQTKGKLSDLAKDAECKFVSVLREAEETAVQLQDEICNLDEIKTEMCEEIERLQREFLIWEKKWKMAVEARERVEKERAATGEIGAMKLEIHRMEVRYSQLRKVQEKLSQDLEMCISRRDNILDLAQAREKRSSSTKNKYTREQFNKKLEGIKQKIKQINSSLKSTEKEIEEMELRREELMNEYIRKQKHLTDVKQGVDKLELEIQEGQLHKYKNLELIVREQRKIRLLEDIKYHRYKLFSRNENNLPIEEEKQEIIGSNILQVVQALIGDFPKLRLQLLQIFNTITSPIT